MHADRGDVEGQNRGINQASLFFYFSCGFSINPPDDLTIMNFILTLWLHSSGGRTSAQLWGKPLAVVRWLTDCTAELRLAAETSWSVSTSPRQSGDCDTLQKSMLSICPHNQQDHHQKFINAINCFCFSTLAKSLILPPLVLLLVYWVDL